MARAQQANAYATPPPLANWSQKHECSTAKRRARKRCHGLSSAAISAVTLAEPQRQLGLRNRRGWRTLEPGGDRMGGAHPSSFRARNVAERGREHGAISRLLVPPQVRIAGVEQPGTLAVELRGGRLPSDGLGRWNPRRYSRGWVYALRGGHHGRAPLGHNR